MSELVWKPAGAERSAYITVDRLGAPRCAGGMCVTLRDLARVGMWVLEQRNDRSASSATATRRPGRRATSRRITRACRCAIAASGTCWMAQAPLAFGMGIHGQNLFVDRVNDLVIAKFSSQALPIDAARIGLTMRAVSEVRKLLA